MKNALACFLSFFVCAGCLPPYSPTGEDDPTAPQIAAVTPADGTADAAPALTVTVTFTDPVDPATVTVYSVRLLHEGAPVAATVALSADGLTATLTPAAVLTEGGAYTVEVSRQIQDPDGIPLDIGGVDALSVSHFSVAATPPTVLSVLPADEDTVDPSLTEVVVTFSEAMDPATITQATLLVSDLQGTVIYDKDTDSAVFIFDDPLASLHTYTVFVAGTVTDAAGIPLGNDVVSRFTTTE